MPNDLLVANKYADGMPKTFVGSRVRQLRSERGFSQAALAQTLEISPSYLNQIEHDVRPLTVAVLMRITEVFGVDATFFAAQDDTRLVAELREVMYDRDLDTDVDPAEVAGMVATHPAIARAMVNLHRRYRLTSAQLAEATEDRFNLNTGGSGTGSISPVTFSHRMLKKIVLAVKPRLVFTVMPSSVVPFSITKPCGK